MTLGLLQNDRMALDPLTAQGDGTSVQAAKRLPALKLYLLARLIKLSERLDMGTRMRRQEEYQECIDRILDEVPALTIEEVELVFRDLERGRIPLYNRLKMPEVLAALLEYDRNQAIEVREQRMQRPKDDKPRLSQQQQPWLTLTEADLLAINDAHQKTNREE